MVITRRDLDILKVCLEQKYLNLVQIAKMFFPECKKVLKVPLRRINKLMREGLIKALKPLVGRKTLYIVYTQGA